MPQLPPFKIGPITIDPPLVLAPMAGISHSPFRRLVAGFTPPGLFFSEMLSARHLPYDVKKKSLWLRSSALEHPMAWQIVTPNPEEAAIGAAQLSHGEIIDLNLACPAPNIARRRAGGHLLSDLKLTDSIIKAVRQAAPQAMTVKIRLGKKPDLLFLRDLAAVIEENGVDAITLHPRLTTEKLKRRARWEYIGHLKEMVKIPVIGNGDVNSCADCLKMTAQTGCDGVMIGREAVRRPWIFAEICGREQVISPEFLLHTYEEMFDEIRKFFPPRMAMGRIKEFTWHFSTNLKFGHRLAARMQSLKDLDACLNFIRQNFITAC